MKKILTIVALFLTINIYSQDIYSLIKEYDNTIESIAKKDYKLILISSSRCRHCLIALDRLRSIETKLQIIVVDYGYYKKREKHKKKYFNYLFLDGHKVKKISTPDFFPILYLYNKEDKLIWEKKGWFKRNVKKINSLIK